jgi:hypothetical protein
MKKATCTQKFMDISHRVSPQFTTMCLCCNRSRETFSNLFSLQECQSWQTQLQYSKSVKMIFTRLCTAFLWTTTHTLTELVRLKPSILTAGAVMSSSNSYGSDRLFRWTLSTSIWKTKSWHYSQPMVQVPTSLHIPPTSSLAVHYFCNLDTFLSFPQITTPFRHTAEPCFYIPVTYVFPSFTTFFQVPSISLYSQSRCALCRPRLYCWQQVALCTFTGHIQVWILARQCERHKVPWYFPHQIGYSGD